MNGYILWFVVSSILCHYGYISATVVIVFTKYPTTGVRLQHQYKTQQYSSHSLCVVECSRDSKCLAANYHETSQYCELNNNSAYSESGYNFETVADWVVYTTGIPSCDNDWLSNEQYCYFISSNKVVWNDAVTACQTMGASLVQIESETEDVFIVERLEILHGNTAVNFHYWTNGNDKNVQYQWEWGHPGGQAIEGYMNWGAVDPNGGSNEDCVALYGYMGFKWVDIQCSSLLYYICEKTHNIQT